MLLSAPRYCTFGWDLVQDLVLNPVSLIYKKTEYISVQLIQNNINDDNKKAIQKTLLYKILATITVSLRSSDLSSLFIPAL